MAYISPSWTAVDGVKFCSERTTEIKGKSKLMRRGRWWKLTGFKNLRKVNSLKLQIKMVHSLGNPCVRRP